MNIRFEESALSEGARHVLKTLGSVGPGYGLQGPEDKGWQRSAQELIDKGFAEEVWGFYALTDAGRSQLRPNSGDNGELTKGTK